MRILAFLTDPPTDAEPEPEFVFDQSGPAECDD